MREIVLKSSEMCRFFSKIQRQKDEHVSSKKTCEFESTFDDPSLSCADYTATHSFSLSIK